MFTQFLKVLFSIASLLFLSHTAVAASPMCSTDDPAIRATWKCGIPCVLGKVEIEADLLPGLLNPLNDYSIEFDKWINDKFGGCNSWFGSTRLEAERSCAASEASYADLIRSEVANILSMLEACAACWEKKGCTDQMCKDEDDINYKVCSSSLGCKDAIPKWKAWLVEFESKLSNQRSKCATPPGTQGSQTSCNCWCGLAKEMGSLHSKIQKLKWGMKIPDCSQKKPKNLNPPE
jgi:hypothetical protein